MQTKNTVEIDDENGLFPSKIQMPKSGIMSKSFRRWYLERINESPQIIQPRENAFENAYFNQEEAWRIITHHSDKKIDQYTFKHLLLNIYQIETSKNDYYYFLIYGTKQENANINGFIRFFYDQKKLFTIHGVWRDAFSSGLIFDFTINWLFKKYPLILTDTINTPTGKNYLEKLIKYCFQHNIETGTYYNNQFQPFSPNNPIEKAWDTYGSEKQIYFQINNLFKK
jgi:hypothetical protein